MSHAPNARNINASQGHGGKGGSYKSAKSAKSSDKGKQGVKEVEVKEANHEKSADSIFGVAFGMVPEGGYAYHN